MDITEVKVYLRKNRRNGDVQREGERRLLAYVAVTISNDFVVRDIKVISGNKGLFVAMPSKKVERSSAGRNGDPMAEDNVEGRQYEYKDVAHPICTESRNYLSEKVLNAYREKCREQGIEDIEDY